MQGQNEEAELAEVGMSRRGEEAEFPTEGRVMSERIIFGLEVSEWVRVASEYSPINNAFMANLFDRKALKMIGENGPESEIRDYQRAAQIFREAAA